MTATDANARAAFAETVSAGPSQIDMPSALYRAAVELALARSGSLAQALFAGVYSAAVHRQWAAGGPQCPSQRRPYFDAQLMGDALAVAAEAELGLAGTRIVERWIFGAWPVIAARATDLCVAEEIACVSVHAETLVSLQQNEIGDTR